MGKRVAAIYGGIAVVTQFELDESIFNDPEMRIKEFEGPSKEWAMYSFHSDSSLQYLRALGGCLAWMWLKL